MHTSRKRAAPIPRRCPNDACRKPPIRGERKCVHCRSTLKLTCPSCSWERSCINVTHKEYDSHLASHRVEKGACVEPVGAPPLQVVPLSLSLMDVAPFAPSLSGMARTESADEAWQPDQAFLLALVGEANTSLLQERRISTQCNSLGKLQGSLEAMRPKRCIDSCSKQETKQQRENLEAEVQESKRHSVNRSTLERLPAVTGNASYLSCNVP